MLCLIPQRRNTHEDARVIWWKVRLGYLCFSLFVKNKLNLNFQLRMMISLADIANDMSFDCSI